AQDTPGMKEAGLRLWVNRPWRGRRSVRHTAWYVTATAPSARNLSERARVVRKSRPKCEPTDGPFTIRAFVENRSRRGRVLRRGAEQAQLRASRLTSNPAADRDLGS